MPETRWSYKKHNKILSGIYVVGFFLFFSYHNDARSNKHQVQWLIIIIIIIIKRS